MPAQEFAADPFGRLVSPADDSDGAVAAAAEQQWRVLSPGPELWVALRQGEKGLGADLLRWHPGKAVLSGDLAEMPAAELLELIHRSRRTGALIVSGHGVERALLFRGGNLVWATSTHRTERVDELLCRADLISRAVLLRSQLGHDALELVARQVRLVVRGLMQATGAFCFLRCSPMLPELPLLDTEAMLGECLLIDLDS